MTRLRRELARRCFPGSGAYWEARYRSEGTSGRGSYGRLAEFKAEVLNSFVASREVRSVIELGCGDGNQLSLARYPRYVGLDVSTRAIELCEARFRSDETKSFFVYDPLHFVNRRGALSAELALSLDVIYHLVEEATFQRHLRHLFGVATRFVAIYSSNSELIEPNSQPHVRHRRFSSWIDDSLPEWELDVMIPNRYSTSTDPSGSASDFYFYRRRAPSP
ncbi:MAG: class I SAM-dependent methyltransferase [Deltaproteobacteria bacterium]|nr:class I SAM-dependent methyltransferase [Deltaproteobacteria bacterium]